MFTIPNEIDAFNPNQAEPDKVDFDIIAMSHAGTGVVSGCGTSVTGTNMVVTVAVGKISYLGVPFTVAGGSVTIPAADGTNPRFDLIMTDDAGNLITPAPGDGKGTAAAEPVFPTVPAARIVLASVYVPAGAVVITANKLTDKRVTVPLVPAVKIITAGTQSIPLGTETQVTIFSGGATVYDNDLIADRPNNRLVCKTAGVYHLMGAVSWDGAGSTFGLSVSLKVNGTIVAQSLDVYTGIGVALVAPPVSVDVKLAVNDLVTLHVFHNASVSKNVKTNSPAGTILSAHWVARA